MFPRNFVMDRKAFATARNVKWSCIPAVIPDEQYRVSALFKHDVSILT